MKLSIASDHGGVELRKALAKKLQEQGHKIIEYGPNNSDDSVDYPDFAFDVGKDVASKKADFGILICKTGIGICIAANKVKGIRAAVIHNENDAEMSRRHNDANVICFNGNSKQTKNAETLLKIFLNTKFEGGRHQRRIDKIIAKENE